MYNFRCNCVMKVSGKSGEYYYSTNNDTLYYRDNKTKPWIVKCDSSCRDTKCIVKNTYNYYFYKFIEELPEKERPDYAD